MADPHDFEELVMAHIDAENAKALTDLQATYGEAPSIRDVPSGHVYDGWGEIKAYYEGRWAAFPTASRMVNRVMSSEDGCYVELTVEGRHDGPLHGLAATGKLTRVELCYFFEPDGEGRIGSITLYYDAMSILTQLGVLPDLNTPVGKAWLGMSRPKLLFKAVADRLSGQ